MRMRDITLGQYAYRESFIHRLDPRTKMVASLALLIGLMATRSWIGLGCFAVLWLVAVWLSKLGYSLALRNLRPFAWLVLLTFLAQAFFASGRIVAVVPVLGLRITQEGLQLGALYAARLALLIVFAALLTLTTAPMELADGLEKLLRPLRWFRIPTHDLVMMMSLSLRFVPTLVGEAERIRNAQLSRGARLSGSIRERVRAIVPLVVPLFLSAFRRADELAMAMDARCYHGGDGRTSFRRLTFGVGDYATLGTVGLCLFIALA